MNDMPRVIRPMTLGEILDKAIRLYRQNFLKFIGIYAIPYIPLVLIQMALSILYASSLFQPGFLEGQNPAAFQTFGIAALIGSVVAIIASFVLVGGFATAALTRAVANNYMDKPIGILDSYRAILRSVWKLMFALFLVFIVIMLLLIWSVIPIIGWLSGPGIILFIMLIVSPLIAPIAALENLSATATIRRAWDLGRSRFWWLFGYAVILAILGQLIVTGPTYLLSAVLQSVLASLSDMSFEMQSILNSIASNLVTMTLGLLYGPLQLTMMTVVYFDLRARNEGLDLALQLAPAEEGVHDTASLPEISGITSTPLITGIDLGRFALLSLAGVVLIGCYFSFILALVGLMGAGF